MSNKFLERYQALWDPKVGDKVRVVQLTRSSGTSRFTASRFTVGDIGIIGYIWKFSAVNIIYYIDFEPLAKGQGQLYREEIELIEIVDHEKG
jgi:hypothetical protein